jgi:hypothetical protein
MIQLCPVVSQIAGFLEKLYVCELLFVFLLLRCLHYNANCILVLHNKASSVCRERLFRFLLSPTDRLLILLRSHDHVLARIQESVRDQMRTSPPLGLYVVGKMTKNSKKLNSMSSIHNIIYDKKIKVLWIISFMC